MVGSPTDLPDWTQGFLLIGQDGSGNPVVMLVDDDGQLQVLLRGADAGGDPQTVKVDSDGQLYTVLRGASGEDVSVDASGFITSVLKGIDGGAVLRTLLTDTSGRIVMVPYGTTQVEGTATVTQEDSIREIQGADGETLRTIVVDSSGQMIMVPRGQSGVYMNVDASGYLYARLVAQDGAEALRYVRSDTSGQIIMVPRGATGYYMSVDASGYLTTVLKAIESGTNLRTVACDSDGQMIMVPKGQSGYYMAVDSDGFLTAVLKGDDSGTLTTIKVDTAGRIEAFGLDAEDQWGQTLKVGNAELAARLGSVVGWDRRGLVAWQSDFRHGIGSGLKYPTGTGSSITLVPDYFLTGGYSVKMVGGSDGDHTAYIDFKVEIPPSMHLGLEITFSYPDEYEYVMARIQGYTGGKFYYGAVRHEQTNDYVQYLNSSNVWTNIAIPLYLTGAEMFHRLKVVIDLSTQKYKRVLYAATEADLSAQSLYEAGSGYSAALTIRVECNSRSANNDLCYLDSIVLTTGEPD